MAQPHGVVSFCAVRPSHRSKIVRDGRDFCKDCPSGPAGVAIGFDWLCLSTQPSFLAQERGKLALFGADDDTRPPDCPQSFPLGLDGRCFSTQSSFLVPKGHKLALFGANDDRAGAQAAAGTLETLLRSPVPRPSSIMRHTLLPRIAVWPGLDRTLWFSSLLTPCPVSSRKSPAGSTAIVVTTLSAVGRIAYTAAMS